MKPILQAYSHYAAAFLAGIALVFSFAPYGWSIVHIGSLCFFFWLISSTPTPGKGFFMGWAYGTGWMVSVFYWLFYSLHQFGGLNALLAVVCVLLLGISLALLPACATAAAMWLRKRFSVSFPLFMLCLLPSFFALAEWVRGWLFTGLPWGVTGYAHTDSALAGFAPVIGVYGITWLAAIACGCIVLLLDRKRPRRRVYFFIVLAIVLAGYGLKQVSFTRPAGEPINVSLLQGNITQEMKFRPETIDETLAIYEDMILAAPADLIVTPETAFPVYLHMLSPDFFGRLEDFAVASNSTLALGIAIADTPNRFTNSIIVVSPDTDRPHHIAYRYDKQHLVPFGEFVPWGFRWFITMLNIPMGDFSRGDKVQAPFAVKGQYVMPGICYEDLFGEEIARQIRRAKRDGRPEPGILLNVSNIAWFGNSLALPQHLQISRMRALEMQRPMIRATNTGATAIIDAQGRTHGVLAWHTFGTLTGKVQAYHGWTPYILLGNWPIATGCLILVLFACWRGRVSLKRKETLPAGDST